LYYVFYLCGDIPYLIKKIHTANSGTMYNKLEIKGDTL